MARRYAQTFTAIWNDPEFCALDERSQRTYWMLSSQMDISAVGLLPLTYSRYAGTSCTATKDSIHEDLVVLHKARFVVVDEQTDEILVRTFTKWDEGYGNAKRRQVILRAAGEVRSLRLRRVLAVEFAKLGLPLDTLSLPEADAPSDTTSGLAEGRMIEDGPSSQVDSPSDGASDDAYRFDASAMDVTSTSDGLAVTQGLCNRTANQEPKTAALLGDDDPAIAAVLATTAKPTETKNQRCRRLTMRYTDRVRPSNYNAIFKLTNSAMGAFADDEVAGGLDALAAVPEVTVSANSLRLAILCAQKGEPFTWNGRASPNQSGYSGPYRETPERLKNFSAEGL